MVRTIGYVVGLGLTVASAPLVIRHLGIVSFGEYVTVVSVMTITTGVTEGGVQALAVREYAVLRGRERDDLMRSLMGLRIVLSAAGVVAGVAFAAAAGYRDVLVVGAAVAGFGLALVSIQMLVVVPLQTELRLTAMTLIDVVRQVLMVVLMIALVIAGASVLPFLAVFAVAAVPPLVVTGWLVRDRLPLLPAWRATRWRSLMAAMLPFAAVTVLAVVYFRLSVVALSLVASGEETGYFATGFRVLEAFIGIPGLLGTTVFPIFARAAHTDTARLRYATEKVLHVAVIGGLWLTIAVALGADFIVQVLAGDEGEPAVDVLRVQALTLLPAFVANVTGFVLLSMRRQREAVTAIGLGLVLSLVLTLTLGDAHGAMGAAVAIAIAEAAIAVTALVLLFRSGDEMRVAVRPLLPVIPAALAAASIGLTELPSLVQALAGTAVYFGILLALRGLPSEIFEALLRRTPQERG